VSDTRREVRVNAPAKINLTLHVLGRRPDGYHDLRTTFQSIALHDTLTFVATRGPMRIASSDPRCPTDRSNLVWRAANALWRLRGRRGEVSGVAVHIRKRIPMQAGLGGGSSDAAATLRGLAALWRMRVSDHRLEAIAGNLGADVAFFLRGGTTLGVDRGDELYSLMDHPPAWVVLAVPDFGVSTPDAYRWWDERHTARRRARTTGVRNDLQAPVAVHHPRITRIVNALRRVGARDAAMSGSGSAVFGLFDDAPRARRAATALRAPACAIVVTETLSRRAYQSMTVPR
jgi:4-diphosphocytidyl-2-C-methyl-D-erythritol kinase